MQRIIKHWLRMAGGAPQQASRNCVHFFLERIVLISRGTGGITSPGQLMCPPVASPAGAADLANQAAALALLQLVFPEHGAAAVRRLAAAGSLVAGARLAASALPERRRRAALGRLRRSAHRLPQGMLGSG